MTGPDRPAGAAAGTVCAVVVTYNRAELLGECLDRLAAQTRPVDEVLVVDNASTDATAGLLAAREDVTVLRLGVNGGGAGGFAAGLEAAYARGHTWFWLLDDDTFAEPSSLEALLAAADRADEPPSVLTSVVRWKDGRLHPMNRPWLRVDRRVAFAQGAQRGLAAIRAATFVSTMVSRAAVARHGLPKAHYFLWLDDIEYTGRILRDEAGYMVPESVVVHWTARPHDTVASSGERFYFKVRNHLWLLRGGAFAGLEHHTYAVSYVRAILTYVRGSRPRRTAARVVARGLRDGLRGEPR